MLAKKILAVFTAVVLVAASAFTVLNASAEEGVLVASGGDIASGGDVEEPTEEETESSIEETTEESREESSESVAEEESTEESTEESAENTTEDSETVHYAVANVDIKSISAEDEEASLFLSVVIEDLGVETAEGLKNDIDVEKANGDVAVILEVEVYDASEQKHDTTVTLTFWINGIKASDEVTVVHWITDNEGNLTGEVEYIIPDEVRDGEIDVTFTSLSPIAIVVNSEVETETQAPVEETTAAEVETETSAEASADNTSAGTSTDTAEAPLTGDMGYGVSLAVCVIAFCGTVAAVVLKKRIAE